MYSFDVFDTLITRATATPQGIFALMREKLALEKDKNGLEDYVIDNFFELRIHSEELIRKSGMFQEVEEVTLREIYRAMAVCGCLSEDQIDYLCDVEQNVEIAYVEAIDINIDRVKKLLSERERVVLISDMYLSAAVIRKMLLKTDPIFQDIPLYVSSEYGKRKTTGNLYRQVRELEKVAYENWTHIGDNLHQDIDVPYHLGIKVELSPRMKPTEFERTLLDRYRDDSKIQMIIGMGLKGRQKTAGGHIGYRYAGPLLYSYGEWVVNQAVKRQIKRLYFIARDGYLVKKVVDIVLEAHSLPIETYYIYGSRKAWRMPSLSEEHYNLYQLILWSHVHRIGTLSELSTIMHVPVCDLYQYLPGTYYKNPNNDKITSQELEYIVDHLAASEDFKKYHLERLCEERKLAQAYLAQEIYTGDDHFAFVDVSGGGLTQGCLRELMKDSYRKPIRTFFFKIDRVNLVKDSITITFMPSFLENNLTIEMICRAPHGQTRGYIRKDGKVVPVLEEAETEAFIAHGFYDYEKGITDFARSMCQVSKRYERNIGSLRNVICYLRHIAQKPSGDVLEYFASMPSSESGRGTETQEYAPRLTEEEIRKIFLERTTEPEALFYKGTNLNYSIMRATDKERALIERYRNEHDSILGKLCRQEKEREENRLRSRYGQAAFYPIRLLEEKIILYGAGRFGQNLCRRLQENGEHQIMLWVDKKADDYRKKGMIHIWNVCEILKVEKAQIVIAIVDQEVADEICCELKRMGVESERIMWIQPFSSPNPPVRWKSKGIG